jgi:hypothetical protein
VVPSRESNSGLPYSKPTRYQLSHAAPLLVNIRLSITIFFFQEPKFHKDLALVLMTELLYGKKALPGDNVLVALVLIRVRTHIIWKSSYIKV